tara:strand:- start:10717 stop:10857 length:141 start_codon:yes stop_codon:yes gene_type:complete
MLALGVILMLGPKYFVPPHYGKLAFALAMIGLGAVVCSMFVEARKQ